MKAPEVMASKRKKHKKAAIKKRQRIKKPLPRPVKRLTSKKSARRKIDPQTGIEISRRQYEKKYGRKKRDPGIAKRARNQFKLYLGVRDDYIEKQRSLGKKISKREAMQSEQLKKIIRDLHSKDPIRKAAALARTGRITPDQIELYAQRFADEE